MVQIARRKPELVVLMADPRKKLPSNVPGDFFVDASCINCDTCRQIAPRIFGEAHGHSFVKAQPGSTPAARDATRALLSCPTGSIGTSGANTAKEVAADFPVLVDDGVYYCGYTSPKSFGASSYFVTHKSGNWLIDSPKYVTQLISRIEELGGIRYIFLTHRDDVAEAHQYARHFGARRIIHEDDASAQADAEIILSGSADRTFENDFDVIATPGHTRGHCVLLYKHQYLFTGDHMAWQRDEKQLVAWPDVCWYDWELQKQSVRKLAEYRFEWVLPGHGQRVNLLYEEMQSELASLVQRLDTL